MKKALPVLGAAIGMLILILDGKAALAGAQQGLELCIRSVIPALFPFFILSTVLTDSLLGAHGPVLHFLERLFQLPTGCGSILIPAFLGGYPAGAQNIGQLYGRGILDRDTAQQLLAFCSNAGPSFLFGIAATQLAGQGTIWAVWVILILSALCTARIIRVEKCTVILPQNRSLITLPEAMQHSIRAMASVCGWVILFRVLIAFLNRWFLWLLPDWMQTALIGILELSNGCCTLREIADPSLRMLICCGILSFGGLCVAMQTASVVHGLSLKQYCCAKTGQSFLAVMLASLYLRFGWTPLILFLVILILITGIKPMTSSEKNSSILRSVRV